MEHENDILTVEKPTNTQEHLYEKKSIENPTIQREYSKFTDYSNEKTKKDYEEFEIIQTYKPKLKQRQQPNKDFQALLDEQNNFEPSKETFVYEKVKPQKKLKRTSKIFVVVCCAIALLMGTLGIVNAVKINDLNFSNVSTGEKIANVGKEIVKIDQVIEGMTSEGTIKDEGTEGGMEQVTVKTEIDLIEKNKLPQQEKKTNFFDKICNFFNSLFGG